MPPGPKRPYGGRLGPFGRSTWGRKRRVFELSSGFPAGQGCRKKSVETLETEGQHFEEMAKKPRKWYKKTSRQVTQLPESPTLRTSGSKRGARAYYARVHSSIYIYMIEGLFQIYDPIGLIVN